MQDYIAIFVTYFLEMLISYIFFSQIGERKYNSWLCCLVGTAVFSIGAVCDIVFNNTVWINAVTFLIIHFLFALLCFNIKIVKIAFYSILLDIFSAATEVVTIFIISAVTNTEITAYIDNLNFFVIDVAISKTLYFIICLIVLSFVKDEKSSVKIPIALFIYPVITVFALVVFWNICASYELSNKHQIALSAVSMSILFSTIILFIVYQHSVDKENQYLIMAQKIEKANVDKKFYDILEQQNNELMIYVHDTKNHLNAIRALNNNEQIDKYLNKMTDELKIHSSTCHSGNHLLDVIINKYYTECEIKGINFDFDVRASNLLFVDDYDLVTILGNILDNAIEAACKAKDKFIYLNTNNVNTYASLVVTNSCDTPPKIINGNLKTTKDNQKAHGIGLKSIRKILKKYKGDLEWEYDSDNKQFITTIILK